MYTVIKILLHNGFCLIYLSIYLYQSGVYTFFFRLSPCFAIFFPLVQWEPRYRANQRSPVLSNAMVTGAVRAGRQGRGRSPSGLPVACLSVCLGRAGKRVK